MEFESFNISYSTIETDGVSNCHFILINGTINKKPFAYVSHAPKDYHRRLYSPQQILIHVIKKIINNIRKFNSKKPPTDQFEVLQTTDLQLLIGGGVDDGINIIQEGLLLLNNNIVNIKYQLQDPQYKHLYENLRGKVTTIPPITYLQVPLIINNDTNMNLLFYFYFLLHFFYSFVIRYRYKKSSHHIFILFCLLRNQDQSWVL